MQFKNLNPVPLFGSYKDPFGDRRGIGPTRSPEAPKCKAPIFPESFSPDSLYFCWLGHSSVFLRLHGKSILIDPVFSMHTSPIPGFGPKRFDGNRLKPGDFPAIDLVLITHSHYDHLDLPSLRALNEKVSAYIVPCGVGKILERNGIASEKITELNWYEETEVDGLSVICTPSQHGSARSPFDQNRTLWCSYVLKDGCFTVFDTGDGGFGNHFEEIHRRYGDADLAIMECGQYNERWHGVHMFPEESAEASRKLHAALAVPVHWGSFVLSDHAWDDPPKRFARRAKEISVPYQIPKMNEWIEISKRGYYEKEILY